MKDSHPRKRTVVKRTLINHFQWPQDLAALLGKIPDVKLAKLAGVSGPTVAQERQRRGIAPFQAAPQPVEWTVETIAQLGTDSDGVICQAMGVSRSTVRCKRVSLGIPSYYPPPPYGAGEVLWGTADLALLGKMPDAEVARQLGIGADTVTLKRKSLKIRQFRPPQEIYEWTEEMLALLGKVTDSEFSRLFGVSVVATRRKRIRLRLPSAAGHGEVVPTRDLIGLLRGKKSGEIQRRTGLSASTVRRLRQKLGIEISGRWTPEIVARLGRDTDLQVARKLGIHRTSVRKKRARLGIAASRTDWYWRPEEDKLLGTAPDAEIAQRIGRSREAVRRRRKALRIPRPGLRQEAAAIKRPRRRAPLSEET